METRDDAMETREDAREDASIDGAREEGAVKTTRETRRRWNISWRT